MMFLQFFIWGVWYVPMWNFIGGIEIAQSWKEMKLLDPVGLAYASTGLAAMISPFIVGMVADRFFPTQIVFGVLHLLGALFLYMASQATTYDAYFPYLLLHLVCYMPTLALANSVLFQSTKIRSRCTTHSDSWYHRLDRIRYPSRRRFFGAGEFTWQMPQFLGGPEAPSGDGVTALGATTWPYTFGVGLGPTWPFAFSLPNTPSP